MKKVGKRKIRLKLCKLYYQYTYLCPLFNHSSQGDNYNTRGPIYNGLSIEPISCQVICSNIGRKGLLRSFISHYSTTMLCSNRQCGRQWWILVLKKEGGTNMKFSKYQILYLKKTKFGSIREGRAAPVQPHVPL